MLGQRISELRTAIGCNQVDLAKKLGVAKQTVSNWENENIQPSIEMLIRLAKLFNVTRLNTEGLPVHVVAHLSMLIEDYRQR